MDLIPSFVARKHGKEVVEYPHPLLEKVLAETYGIMVYQEQVMQTAQVLGGYSLGGADLLRRAMGKKKPRRWPSTARSSAKARPRRASARRRPTRSST
jgi:DNA polymerase-3 subunit alpha